MQEFAILSDAEHRVLGRTPDKGFIPQFEKWAGMKTDAPPYTLKAAALQALSLAAGDTVIMPGLFSDSPTHMNLYIMVVGPSTTMRKTTVLNYVRGLLPKHQQTGKDYISFLDDVSTQAFNKAMAEAGKRQSPLMFSVDEVAGLFEVVRRKNSYLSGFDKVLLKAYDHSPVMIQRTNSKIEVERGCFVNIFAASTPEPLMEVLNSDDVESGLLPRFLIFDSRDAARGERLSLMERRKRDDVWLALKAELQAFLYLIARDRADGLPIASDLEEKTETYPTTVLDVTDSAMERLDAIDELWTREAATDSTGWGAIKGRAFWHIVKLSGLFALSRKALEAEVELIDVLRAAHLVEETVGDLIRMSDEVGANALERRVNEVMELINSTRNGKIAQSVIGSRLGLSYRELNDLYQTVKSRDLIKKYVEEEGRIYWERS